MAKPSDELHHSGPLSGAVRLSPGADGQATRAGSSRRILLVASVLVIGLGVGAFLLIRHLRRSQHFVLPGWEDVLVGEHPPRDVELTCAKANETSDCHATRSGAPIQELLVTRRPDALGVLRVMVVGVDPTVLSTVKARWGSPTIPGRRGRGAVWCSTDGNEAASIDEPFSATSGGDVIITDEPDTWLIDACVRLRAAPTKEPDQTTLPAGATREPAPGMAGSGEDTNEKRGNAVSVIDFVGSCPFCEVRGRHLFDLPGIEKDLVQKFGRATWDRLASFSDGPGHVDAVEHDLLGTIVVASQCMKHHCDAHNLAVFLTPTGSVIGVCLANDGTAEWRSGRGTATRTGDCFGLASAQVEILSKVGVLKSQ